MRVVHQFVSSLVCACFYGFSFRYGVWNIHVKRNLSKTYWDVVQTKNSKHVRVLVSELHLTLKRLTKMWLVEFHLFKKIKRKFWPHFSVSYSFQRFIPVSAFYPHFSVLSPIQRFTLISVFYPHFSVLSPFQRCIPISVFYPQFSVLSSFQCFILISVFYPYFSVLSPFQRCIPISVFYPHFSVLSPFQFPFSVSICLILDLRNISLLDVV